MRVVTFAFVFASFGCLVFAFLFTTRGAGAETSRSAWWDEDVARFVRERVAASYVDELDEEQAREAFYRAMDAYLAFDGYCDFIPPAEQTDWREDIEGKYAGIGVKVEAVDEGLRLIGVMPGGPAAQAGLAVGDTLLAADGVSLAGLPVEEVTTLLKGAPDTQVRLSVLPGPAPAEEGEAAAPREEVVVRRGVVRPPSVFVRRVGENGRFGVIRIEKFAEETVGEFDHALDTLVAQGVSGLVVDLRRNGGGVLGAAVDVADRFLGRGVVVRMQGRARTSNKNHTARDEADDVDLPLVVLVDGHSASASEIVAGALQDHRRAVIVGERTYGKFLVQEVTEIPGTGAAVKLTTSRYYTPNGRSYQGPPPQGLLGPTRPPEPAGLFPDVIVPLGDEDRDRIDKRCYDEVGAAWGSAPRFEDVPADWIDPQLERAVKLLAGEVALSRIRQGRARAGG